MKNQTQDKIVAEKECVCPLAHRDGRSAFAFWMLHQAVLQQTKDEREPSLENLSRQHDFIRDMEMRSDLVLVFCENDRVSLTTMWEALPQSVRDEYAELARKEEEQPRVGAEEEEEKEETAAVIPEREPDSEFSSYLCSCGAWKANYAKTQGNMIQ